MQSNSLDSSIYSSRYPYESQSTLLSRGFGSLNQFCNDHGYEGIKNQSLDIQYAGQSEVFSQMPPAFRGIFIQQHEGQSGNSLTMNRFFRNDFLEVDSSYYHSSQRNLSNFVQSNQFFRSQYSFEPEALSLTTINTNNSDNSRDNYETDQNIGHERRSTLAIPSSQESDHQSNPVVELPSSSSRTISSFGINRNDVRADLVFFRP